MKHKIIFIFLDGFGLAPAGPDNPLRVGSMPHLESVVSRPLVAGPAVKSDALLLRGIDACLEVPGIPQSATGQTALFTGVNAARMLGHHYSAFPNKPLIDIIRRENIYAKAQALGKSCRFANAYSMLYFQYVQERRRRHSVTTHCLLAAGLPILTLEDMEEGKAVFWDISRRVLDTYPIDKKYSPVTGQEAGRHLAGLAREHDLVVFESFLPDLIGHKKDPRKAGEFLSLLDEFLKAVLDSLPADTSLVLSSDHGNMEDLTTGLHTMNPVPLLVLGRAAPHFPRAASLTDVTPSILSALSEADS